MAADMEGRDLYLRYQPVVGKSRVQQHRVWDGERFFASQTEQYGPGPNKKPEEIQVVTAATRADYLAYIKK
jgi:hypothetical protein